MYIIWKPISNDVKRYGNCNNCSVKLILFRSETDPENDGRFTLTNILIINSIILNVCMNL